MAGMSGFCKVSRAKPEIAGCRKESSLIWQEFLPQAESRPDRSPNKKGLHLQPFLVPFNRSC